MALGEDDGEDVPEGGERDEDGESALSAGAEDVSEEGRGEDAARARDLGFGHRGEVRDVREHVEDADDGERGRPPCS